MELKGTAASRGAAVGAVLRYAPFAPEISETPLPPEARAAARERLQQAKASAEAELRRAVKSFDGREEGQIFQAHLELLDDEDLWEEVCAALDDGCGPELAADRVFGGYIQLMEANGDERMRERAADIRDVRLRLLRNLAGEPERNLRHLDGPVIVVAHDLLPADTAAMDRQNVLAIVTEVGGQTSHSAILARSYGIPAVLGVAGVCGLVRDGELLAVDGGSGQVIVRPDEAQRRAFADRRDREQARRRLEARYLRAPCRSADGVAVEIGANLSEVSADSAALEPFVDLVGLFRTEFLYMQRETPPTEEEQYDVYRRLLRCYGEKPVVLRTLDVGGDKEVPCLRLPREENPFLGKRALRLCLDREELFTTQLRAALRASTEGTLWIMFPMVGTLEDWRRAKAVADRVRGALLEQGVPVSDRVRYGVMIEVPSLAVMADRIAREADFASIGTNDLCQYTLAVDRGNPQVAEYYQMYAPAVLRLIAGTAEAFRRAGKPLCVCGEMGGDPAACLALVGMGLRKLSMNGSAVAAVKRAIAGRTVAQMEEIAAEALRLDTAAEIETYLKAQLQSAEEEKPCTGKPQ